MNAEVNPTPLSDETRVLLEALLDSNLDHAVIFFSPQALVVDWLGAAERLFGYTKQEALGRPFAALFTEEDKALGLDAQEIALARLSGRSEDDRWHVRQDGSRFWANGVLTTVRGASGGVVAMCKIVRDRTDILMQIRSLESQVASHKAAIERHNRTTVLVAHELRNPMMPMMSAVALLQRSEEPTLRARACAVLERQLGSLKNLIDDLIGSSVLAMDARVQIAIERVSVGQALNDAADSLRLDIASKGQDLRLVLPAEDIWISADPARLQQMLLNLLANASKYTHDGGQIVMSATVEDEMAVIRVEDNGRGIATELIPHLFELFTREQRGAPVPGLGVGLAVVQDLARRHGGGAEVRSPGPGKGSIFSLRLPLYPDAVGPIPT